MKKIQLILSLSLLIQLAIAQDGHYWTEQFGTKSMLLSNSVVGVVEDLGAVYYNPARLALIDNAAFVISGKVYELNKLNVANATGDNAGASQNSSDFGGAPSLVAGTFSIKGWDNHNFAYAFLTRRRMNMNLNGMSDAYGSLIDPLPGDEYFSGELGISKQFTEEWIGGTWSYSKNKRYSVGVTGFVTIRNQESKSTSQLQAYNNEDVATYYNRKSYSFSNYGLLFKIAGAAKYEKLDIGITFTTPTMGLSGSGSFRYEQYFSAIPGSDEIYVRNLQKGVQSTFKTPMSVAVGFGYKLFGGTLMASAEYYTSIDQYNLMQGTEFIGQSNNLSYTPVLYDHLESVTNFGIGYNFVFSERVNGYISYSTDYSASTEENQNLDDNSMYLKASTFTSDINHFGGGIVLNLKKADITLGATLATSSYKMERPIDFPDGNGGSIVDPDEYSKVNWNRWRFIVGISVPFVNDIAKKWENKLTGEDK
ncbi:immunoglobulin domain-containing family protein [Saccharicrinis aurantiacus]|uniref:hypothetical protein n=1 Tax=Saccharicrinis aurantiacus TaxID=1849719 RepID=UPI00094F68A9|nr:hypothetical protein [Saccharicrinis aurantiacus]